MPPQSEHPPSSRVAPVTPRRRLGGRSERVVNDVLRATAGEIARVGYGALRVEDVAAIANVNKTTIYRRWPTKPELVAAAVRALADAPKPLPDSGDLRADLLELLARALRRAATPEGQAVVRMLIHELDHPEVAAVVRTLRAESRKPWLAVLDRAVTRRDLAVGTDTHLVADTILNVLVSRRVHRKYDQLSEAYFVAMIDLVLTGARHGGATRQAQAATLRPPAPMRKRS